MALLKDLLAKSARGGGVFLGALGTRALSTGLGGSGGYQIADKVPLSPVLAATLYAGSAFSRKAAPMLSSALHAFGDGAFAAWGAAVGDNLASNGLSLDAFISTGASPNAKKYAKMFDLADKHSKAG